MLLDLLVLLDPVDEADEYESVDGDRRRRFLGFSLQGDSGWLFSEASFRNSSRCGEGERERLVDMVDTDDMDAERDARPSPSRSDAPRLSLVSFRPRCFSFSARISSAMPFLYSVVSESKAVDGSEKMLGFSFQSIMPEAGR